MNIDWHEPYFVLMPWKFLGEKFISGYPQISPLNYSTLQEAQAAVELYYPRCHGITYEPSSDPLPFSLRETVWSTWSPSGEFSWFYCTEGCESEKFFTPAGAEGERVSEIIAGLQEQQEKERKALWAFREASGGSEWIACKWEQHMTAAQLSGVFCNSQGLVRTIDLRFCELSGEISPALGELQFLCTLNLSNNKLCGKIPESFAELKHLKYLILSNNQDLSGHIPNPLLAKSDFDLRVDGTCIVSDGMISLEVPQFPFHVVPRSIILSMERLKSHEEMGVKCSQRDFDSAKNWREDGSVYCLTVFNGQTLFCWRPIHIDSGFGDIYSEAIVFISHRWLSGPHPDDDNNTKLSHLKRIAQLNPQWEYYWVDFLCVPQQNRTEQIKAINSLPHYVKCCGAMVTLSGNQGESRLEVYKTRGWCRLEQLSSIIPINRVNMDITHPFLAETKLFISNKDTDSFEPMPSLSESELNPLRGVFYDDEDSSKLPQEKDRRRVAECVKVMCEHLMNSQETSPAAKSLAGETLLFLEQQANSTWPMSNLQVERQLSPYPETDTDLLTAIIAVDTNVDSLAGVLSPERAVTNGVSSISNTGAVENAKCCQLS